MTGAATEHPARVLEAVFQAIAQGPLAGSSIQNPALAVQATGFRVHDGRWHGILITPWFMSLIVLPGEQDDWGEMSSGTGRTLALPTGEVAFMHAQAEGLGTYLTHSLFSPMHDFPHQDYALAMAEAVLAELYVPVSPPAQPSRAEAAADGSPPLSRRGFFKALLPPETPS